MADAFTVLGAGKNRHDQGHKQQANVVVVRFVGESPQMSYRQCRMTG